MATSNAQVTDSVAVEVTNEDTKGPDPDRLKGHAAQARAYTTRLRKESASSNKG